MTEKKPLRLTKEEKDHEAMYLEAIENFLSGKSPEPTFLNDMRYLYREALRLREKRVKRKVTKKSRDQPEKVGLQVTMPTLDKYQRN